MIIREFKCLDCGSFFETSESEPECPKCAGSDSERAFLTPPGIRSSNTGRADKIHRELASDFNMSDMTNRHGQPVRQRQSENPAQFTGPAAVQQMNIPSDSRDQFSQVLPMIKDRGPRQWERVRDRK